MNKFWGILSVALLATTSVFAETSEVKASKLKAKDLLENKKFEDKSGITDPKLLAESGSLSRYSLKFNFSYYGPPVGDLSNKNQPNPDGTIGVYEVSLGGSISGRYRIDSKTTISAGGGLSALTPFHGVKRVDFKNPFISYDKNYRIGNFQFRHSPGLSVTTVPIYRDVGQFSSLSYDGSLLYNIGTSAVSVGIDTGLNAFLYERGYEKSDGRVGRYNVSVYPVIKYNFSDRLNLYTSGSMNWWNPRAEDDKWTMHNKMFSARTGLGYSITRDIYFAPFLNYYPQNFKTDSTTLSFSTIFSIL